MPTINKTTATNALHLKDKYAQKVKLTHQGRTYYGTSSAMYRDDYLAIWTPYTSTELATLFKDAREVSPSFLSGVKVKHAIDNRRRVGIVSPTCPADLIAVRLAPDLFVQPRYLDAAFGNLHVADTDAGQPCFVIESNDGLLALIAPYAMKDEDIKNALI